VEKKMREIGTENRHGELLAQTRRLAIIFLDRIETGAKDGSLDQAQMRMFGSLALRSLRLWKETLGKQDTKDREDSQIEPGPTASRADREA
jgi:hypothetical protein